MTVLVDTSVWAAHFRSHNATLVHLLLLDQVRIHPLVVGELACGTPPEPRVATLRHLEQLQPALQASPAEVREFIERERLFGLGCGLIDVSLLASTRITPGASLWTLDKRLAALAERFGVGYSAGLH
jgi:predicted nucleic acid-binding protein